MDLDKKNQGWLKTINQLKICLKKQQSNMKEFQLYVDSRVSFMFLGHQVRPHLDTGHYLLLLLFLTLSQKWCAGWTKMNQLVSSSEENIYS